MTWQNGVIPTDAEAAYEWDFGVYFCEKDNNIESCFLKMPAFDNTSAYQMSFRPTETGTIYIELKTPLPQTSWTLKTEIPQ